MFSKVDVLGRPAQPRWFTDVFFLTALCFLVLLPGLGQTKHLKSRAVRHAEITREMAETGDYFIPTLLGKEYYDKPPVFHTIGALLTKCAGAPSMAAARLPSVLAGWLVVLATYWTGGLLINRITALVGAIALLGMPGFSGMARCARPDMILCDAIVLSGLGRLLGMRATRPPFRVMAFAFAGAMARNGNTDKRVLGICLPGASGGVGCLRTKRLETPQDRLGWVCRLMRRATQDANNIDEWCETMKKGNNGGLAKAWLLGDVNNSEIARLELGLTHVGFERTRDGFFLGSNVAEDLKILRRETDLNESDIRISGVARRVRWKQLMAEHRGKIDATLAREFEADHFDVYSKASRAGGRTLCGHWENETEFAPQAVPLHPYGTIDAKVVDAAMAKRMSFAPRWGSAFTRTIVCRYFMRVKLARHSPPGHACRKPRAAWAACATLGSAS